MTTGLAAEREWCQHPGTEEVGERYYQSFADGDFDRATALFDPTA